MRHCLHQSTGHTFSSPPTWSHRGSCSLLLFPYLPNLLLSTNGRSETARLHLVPQFPLLRERDRTERASVSWSPIPTFTVKSANKLKGRNSKRSCQLPNKSTTNLECTCPHAPVSYYGDTVHIPAFQESLLRWGNVTQNRHTTARGLHSLFRGRCAFLIFLKKICITSVLSIFLT